LVEAFTYAAHPFAFAMQMIEDDEVGYDDPQWELDFVKEFASIELTHMSLRDSSEMPANVEVEVREVGSLDLIKTVDAPTRFYRKVPVKVQAPALAPEPVALEKAPAEEATKRKFFEPRAIPEVIKREPIDIEAKFTEFENKYKEMQKIAANKLGIIAPAMMETNIRR